MDLRRSLNRSKEGLFGKTDDFVRTVEIDLDKLRPNPDQPRKRFSDESLEELANSIKQHGLINPITVKEDPERGEEHYLIVAGERRFRAFQLLNKAAISAVITTGHPDEIALIENIQREDLRPLEEAEALAQLMERHNYSQEELGKVIGKARTTVNEILKLTGLPEDIKEGCRTSDTPRSLLLELTKVTDKEEQLALWEEIRDGKVTVRKARSRKKTDAEQSRPRRPLKDRLLDDARSLVKRLESVDSEDISFDDQEYNELLTLYGTIGNFIERFNDKK